ncbi:BtrH N-terminal domain-containing protein [Clostridium peptidivorans]|uniref:BtrH N-terminal domain-containing protein n=1 Tax=Clostridium peptidivorans TaxID=100174 RepID=UPI000BE2F480|nr:BtrH N-terminal domain-containing protein [Clostridium peptidivorans]
MRKIIDIKHHFDDYECMWNGIEDIYVNKTGECLPNNFFFLLSGFGSFCYLKTQKAELKRMVALGDGRTKKMYEFLAPIVGFEYKHHEYRSFEKALIKAKSEIDSGYPVVLGAIDMFYLPYFEKLYHKEHIPFHYILMVGYDDEKQSIYLYDCGRLELLSLSYIQLRNAMNCNYPGLSKENTICTIRMIEERDKIQIAKDALARKKDSFLNPTTGFLGYKGFEKFISELPRWKDEISKEEYDKILTNMVEFFGTVPTIPNAIKGIDEPDFVEFKGGFDKMSRMLRYLGDETKNDYWTKSAVYFDEGAAVIKRVSDVIIEYLSDKEDNTDLLPKLFAEVLEKMIDGYHALDF